MVLVTYRLFYWTMLSTNNTIRLQKFVMRLNLKEEYRVSLEVMDRK